MKGKTLDLLIFLICVTCLGISLFLLWNMGVFVDESNTTVRAVCGGSGGLAAYWIRLFLLLLLSVGSFVRLIKR